jgi:hypothetical protein
VNEDLKIFVQLLLVSVVSAGVVFVLVALLGLWIGF